jgi:phospholipid transport system substrate-binding protein
VKNRLFRPLSLLIPAVFAGFAALISPVSAPAQENAPAAAVESLHSVLLDGMKRADALGITGRFKLFAPAIAHSFNMRLMTAIACGTHWRKADDAARAKLVEAFTRFSVGTYAARFASWSGESFATSGTRPGPASTTMVDTRIVRTEGKDPVKLSYVVRKFPDGWRIVDVLLDGGISELAVKRSEFRVLLAEKGVDALIASLKDRTEKLLRPAS